MLSIDSEELNKDLSNKITLSGLRKDLADIFIYSFEQHQDSFTRNSFCEYLKDSKKKGAIFNIG